MKELYSHCNNQLPTTTTTTTHASDDIRIQPSRVQIHRAAVDNDDHGYLSRWVACGLDKDMVHHLSEPCTGHVHSGHSHGHSKGTPKVPLELPLKTSNKIEYGEFYDFNSMSIKRVHEKVCVSSSLSSSNSHFEEDTEDTKNMAYGVELFFETKPMEVDQ